MGREPPFARFGHGLHDVAPMYGRVSQAQGAVLVHVGSGFGVFFL